MSSLRIIDCEQNSTAWHAARAGLPTASNFGKVLAKGRTAGAKSETRESYLHELVAERISGEVEEGYSNAAMERGHALEDEARELYAFQQDVVPVRVGFGRRDDLRCGASPDALIDTNGGLEVKTRYRRLQIAVLARGEVPSEHVPQVQGNLLVFCREWWDFVSYARGLPLFVKRVYRDEKYIANLTVELARFNDELDELEARIRAMA